MFDPLADDDELASELVARAIAGRDRQAAELIAAQALRLRNDVEATRAAEAELVAASEHHKPWYRPQFYLGALFWENVTVLRGGRRDHVWVYDDDIVTLTDCGPELTPHERTELNRDPWRGNDRAAVALARLLKGGEARRIGSLRLLLFEGTRRLAPALADLGAAHLVSHLVLWTQREGPESPVAASFPKLRGLAATPEQLPELLRGGAPELRSLVVYGRARLAQTLELAAQLPALRHLGIWNDVLTAGELERVAASPAMDSLLSLELFTVHGATEFPFDAALALEPFQYLRHLGLPGHLVGPEVRSRFAGRPEVTFVSHDRRERIAFDFETIGWAENTR